MKTHLKNIIGGAVLGLTLLAHTSPTWAGFAFSSEVIVRTTHAEGTVQAARFSSDSRQSIGCAVSQSVAAFSMTCTAVDKNGVVLTCKSYDPQLIAVAETMTSQSYISFTKPTGTTSCGGIGVNNSSFSLR